jgi:LacI family transcriptional regulator
MASNAFQHDYFRKKANNRVTINDLAEELGLTKGTISKALNEYNDIGETTKRRVKRKAAEMNYRPLTHAQAIRTGRTRSIGLVLQADVYDGQRPFLADFLAGVSQTASRENWTLTVATPASETEVLVTLRRLIDERKADGFILPRTKVSDPRIKLLRSEDIPFVMFGRTKDQTGCAWYDILGEDAIRNAVERLFELGHREIAFINSDLSYNFADLRLKGFIKGIRQTGLRLFDNFILDGAMTGHAGQVATTKLLRLPCPPTAIVYATDATALGAYKAAKEFDLTIGKEISIIAYDGLPEGAYVTPALTTFKVDTAKAGARLTALLIERLCGTKVEDLRETDAAVFQSGASEGPPILSSRELAYRIKKVIDRN